VKKRSLVNHSQYNSQTGNGVSAKINGKTIVGGSVKHISSIANIDENIIKQADELATKGKTPLLFVMDNRLLGIIAVADVVKSDSPKAIKELQNMGIKVVMVTGDNEKTAQAIAKSQCRCIVDTVTNHCNHTLLFILSNNLFFTVR